MLFPSSRPHRLPPSNADSQYDTTTGYSSSSYTKWPRPPAKSDIYATRFVGSTANSAARPYQSTRRRNHYLNEPFSDILNYQYSTGPEQLQEPQPPLHSTISPQRPTVNYLLPLANDGATGTARQRTRPSNWSSLGSLNSFGDSATTPPSSQEHAGSGGSHTGGSGVSVQQRETLHSRFEFKQTLGKGTYGKVKLALDKRKNEQVAIKTIKKSRIENPHDLARIRREIDFMTSLNHPYIIRIKEVYESREKIILVMEYASGGELYDYLNRMKRIPESQARAIFRQIVSAVHFLHKNQIVHRDLKLENILIDHNGDIKLADFGLSNSWSPRRLLHTFCGSPLYASPEIVSGIPYYGPEVDCWSLGVLLYTLVYGSMPFQGGDYNRLVRNITSGDFIQPREQSGALGLIRKCLTVAPSKRFTVDDIAAHWWLNLGYKYPPVHYYLTPAMRKNGLPMPAHVPALTYNERTKPTTIISEQPPTSVRTLNPPLSSITAPAAPSVQNGHLTDTQSKAKPNIKGYHTIGRSHRLYNNAVTTTTTTTNRANQSLKSNQRTPVERNHGGIIFSPKHPPSRAFSLIQFCLKPDANHRATTKDMLRHDWLAHGPVLSLRLNSNTSSSLSIAEQQSHADYDKVHLRTTPTSTKTTDKSSSPTNSLVELELQTSSFFDTTRLRDRNTSANKEQQRRHRASAIVDTARYYSSNNSKANSSRPTQQRPLSLSLENQHAPNPMDYHFASTSEKPSHTPAAAAPSSGQVYTRRSRRTVSPTSSRSTSTYANQDRLTSPPSSYRYTLAATPESTRRTVSPTSPSRYLVSYDFDTTLRDLKRKPIYKYTPAMSSNTTELNVVPSLSNSTTSVAPSVFTTSAIKFAPAPTRLKSSLKDQDHNIHPSSINPARVFNTTSNLDETKHNTTTNSSPSATNRRSLLTSVDSPPSTTNFRKSRLLDDNNNLIS